jgi:Zn-dependent peptidase ImmA (M78 family)
MTAKTDRRERQQLSRILVGRVLADLGIKDPDDIDIEAIAAHYDCFVRDGGLSGADGRVYANDKRAIIRVRKDITDIGRRRYIIAHEFGHVRHKHNLTLSFCSDTDMARYESGDAEVEANAFASELLMPHKMLKPLLEGGAPSFEVVEELLQIFRTSFTATAIRLVDLAEDPCAVVWSHGGRIKWSVRSPATSWFIPWGEKLSTYTHASSAFRGLIVPRDPQIVPGDAWIGEASAPEELIEETRWFNRIGATLSILREC